MKRNYEQLTTKDFPEYCHSQLAAHYPAGVPAFAQARLECELALTEQTCAEEDFLLYHALSRAAGRSGHVLHTAGSATGSFLIFLLGQSWINPLPAHYYCPECGWFEGQGDVKFGLDLEARRCPRCGATVRREGFHIAAEMTWDRKSRESGFPIQYRCSEGFAPFALEVVRRFYESQKRAVLPLGAITADDARLLTHIGAAVLPEGTTLCDFPQFAAYLSDGTPCVCGDYSKLSESKIKRIIISENMLPTALQKAQAASGIFAADMLDFIPGVTVRDITNTGLVTDKECMALQHKNQSYFDMACALTFSHNTYREDCFELLETEAFQACPLYTRDDVFDALTSQGFCTDDAAETALFIRSGKAARNPGRMEKMALPQTIRDTAVHCDYLFPRASGAQWLVSLMLLAGYMQHDPVMYFGTRHHGLIA